MNVHLHPDQNCPGLGKNRWMAVNRISFLSIGDLAEELVALGQALSTGKATPGAHRTLQDAASALSTLSAEARHYEAALRSALSALSQNAGGLSRAATLPTRSSGQHRALPIQLPTVLRVEERTGPHAGR